VTGGLQLAENVLFLFSVEPHAQADRCSDDREYHYYEADIILHNCYRMRHNFIQDSYCRGKRQPFAGIKLIFMNKNRPVGTKK